VISERRLRANRANALKATGPKTRHGKSRSAQNARAHGLSVPVLNDLVLSQETEILAHEFAGEGADPTLLEPARRAAEAQIDLIRIRKARNALFVEKLEDQHYSPKTSATEAKQRLELLERLARLPDSPVLSKIREALLRWSKISSDSLRNLV
jgi:hypothetical protein